MPTCVLCPAGLQSCLCELGFWGPFSDRLICSWHTNKNQASGASEARGHTEILGVQIGAYGRQPLFPAILLEVLAYPRGQHLCYVPRCASSHLDRDI